VNLILIGSFSALYLVVHLANSWVFQSIEITSHVSMVYLPAFLRLFNVLVLGAVKGSFTVGRSLGDEVFERADCVRSSEHRLLHVRAFACTFTVLDAFSETRGFEFFA
jgi:hypothetical protein